MNLGQLGANNCLLGLNNTTDFCPTSRYATRYHKGEIPDALDFCKALPICLTLCSKSILFFHFMLSSCTLIFERSHF